MSEYREPDPYTSSSEDEEDHPLILDDVAELRDNEEEASVGSASTTASRGPAFTVDEKKQLVLDIETRGGIDAVSTKQLCDSKPSKYGLPNTAQRRKVQNQINRWKNKQRAEYNTIALGTKKDAQQQTPLRPRRTPPPSPARNRLPNVAILRSPPSIRRTPRSQSRPFCPSPSTMAATGNFIANLLSQDYEAIDVTLEYPERNNGPFFVTYFPNHVHEKTGTLHNAFHIELQDQDMQWMLTGGSESFFAAYFLGGNQVMFKVPSASFSLLKDSATDDAGKQAAGYSEPRSLEAYNVARNAIVNDPDRQFKYYLLSFPVKENEYLDNDIFSPNAENGKLVVDVHPTVKTFCLPVNGRDKSVSSYRCSIVWDIAIIELVPRYVKSAKPRENETVNSLLKNLAGMTCSPARSSAPAPSRSSLSVEDAAIRSNAIRLVNEAAKRENKSSRPPASNVLKPPVPPAATQPPAPPAVTQPPAPSVPPVEQPPPPPPPSSTDLVIPKPKEQGANFDFRVKEAPENLSRQSRLESTQTIRKSKKDKKISAIRMSSLALAAGLPPSNDPPAPSTVVAHFRSGQTCTKAQLDAMITKWAETENMTMEAADQYLQKRYSNDAQQFVNEFEDLLNNEAEGKPTFNEKVDEWKDEEEEDDDDMLANDED